ncbi:MAG: glycosyltransferase [Armatimonadota bacterium]|nr:glycosyltransferase [Armatimonadota bacterium]
MSDEWLVWLGDDWGYQMSSPQQLAKALAGRYRTLWINSVGMRRPRLTRRDLARAFTKLVRAPTLSRETSPEVVVASVPLVPYHHRVSARALNRRIARATVARWRRNLGVWRPVVICALPTGLSIVDALEPRRLIYYCMDDFATLPGVDWPMIEALERDLLAAADRVVAASPWIAGLPRFRARGAAVLPHGVDYDHFARAQQPPSAEIARLVSSLPRPLLGFSGFIDGRIDVELLRAVASREDWGLLIVGEAAVDLGDLGRRRNVAMVGYRPYTVLPDYLAACDVLIAPYVRSQATAALQPLKIPEYLATGKPVVATALPALEDAADIVLLAQDEPGFLAAIERAAALPVAGRAERLARARAQSWQRRAEEFADLVGLHLAQSA